jgi:hypothetical protein
MLMLIMLPITGDHSRNLVDSVEPRFQDVQLVYLASAPPALGYDAIYLR